MPDFPSVFPLWWISLTALVAGLASVVILRWCFKELAWKQIGLLALVVGLSVFAWRTSGNIKELNDDPVPPFSPNDWICPAITYVFVSVYGAFLRPPETKRWELMRAILTIISLVVNVVVI